MKVEDLADKLLDFISKMDASEWPIVVGEIMHHKSDHMGSGPLRAWPITDIRVLDDNRIVLMLGQPERSDVQEDIKAIVDHISEDEGYGEIVPKDDNILASKIKEISQNDEERNKWLLKVIKSILK